MSDHKRNPMNGYYALRWQILQRDNFTCQYCGQVAPNVKLEVDHKLPVEDGGSDNADNLITSCYACNRGKSGLSIILKRKGKSTATPFSISVTSPKRWRQDEANQYIETHPMFSIKDLASNLNISINYARVLVSRINHRK